MANTVLALLAAAAWGGGDFAGGMGVKAAGGSTRGALRIVIAGHAISFVVLITVLTAQHADWPTGRPLFWGVGGGLAAGLSLTAFYMALARGAMGASAALSGLLAAAIPAAVSVSLEGAPSPVRLGGFACAALAIWLIAASPAPPAAAADSSSQRDTPALAGIGVIGFGVYFVALRFANPLGVLEPMALARAGSLVTCLLLLTVLSASPVRRRDGAPGSSPHRWLTGEGWLWALGVAVLDTGGNLLFIAATRTGRLDVAAVLASLYPASTILLAAWLLNERPTARQIAGMAVALGAVVLITL